jgi:hypothetical protein
VFLSVIAAGFWIGGQYGDGSLRVGGSTIGYYSTTTGSIGLQIGAQSKAIIFLFMTEDTLARFRNSEGWSVGADASVAVLKVSANGNIDTTTATAPVEAFVLTNRRGYEDHEAEVTVALKTGGAVPVCSLMAFNLAEASRPILGTSTFFSCGFRTPMRLPV